MDLGGSKLILVVNLVPTVGQYTFPSHLDFYSSFSYGPKFDNRGHNRRGSLPVLEALSVAESSSLTSLKVSRPSLSS